MFVGKYEAKLDSKNRVIVPLKLRETREEGGPLHTSFYLTLGAEGCISVYTHEGWRRLMEAVGATQPLADETLRTVQRLVGAMAEPRECDGQGRIILSEELRSHAGVSRDCIWVGAVDRAEIWDRERWMAYQKQNVSQLSEKLDLVSRAGLVLKRKIGPNEKGPDA